MKYLLAIAVGLCLTGCATTSSVTQTTKQSPTHVFMPDGTVYTYNEGGF